MLSIIIEVPVPKFAWVFMANHGQDLVCRGLCMLCRVFVGENVLQVQGKSLPHKICMRDEVIDFRVGGKCAWNGTRGENMAVDGFVEPEGWADVRELVLTAPHVLRHAGSAQKGIPSQTLASWRIRSSEGCRFRRRGILTPPIFQFCNASLPAMRRSGRSFCVSMQMTCRMHGAAKKRNPGSGIAPLELAR
eukprot:jgi/Botrbrau1/1300/Bobra.0063s0017.1